MPCNIAHRVATLDLMRSFAANGLGVGISYTQPAPRISHDGKPLILRALTDAGTEAVVLAARTAAADLPALTQLAATLTVLLTPPVPVASKRFDSRLSRFQTAFPTVARAKKLYPSQSKSFTDITPRFEMPVFRANLSPSDLKPFWPEASAPHDPRQMKLPK